MEGPCLCGDPYCRRYFPGGVEEEPQFEDESIGDPEKDAGYCQERYPYLQGYFGDVQIEEASV